MKILALFIVTLLIFSAPLHVVEAVRLYLVRHADPEYVDLITGGLTQHGKDEAKALAPYLAKLNITHAYTSPMSRAKVTAELALTETPKFSVLVSDENDDGANNNFEANVGIEDWCAEKQTWQASQSKLAKTLLAGTVIWDLPATMIRNQLADTVAGTAPDIPGWVQACPDHGEWIEQYQAFGKDVDAFLARHGIVRDDRSSPNYRMSSQDAANPAKRQAQIVIFGHGGTFLMLLAHLLQIPLPMVHASFWLPPSSVTTILFEEYPVTDKLGNLLSQLWLQPVVTKEEECANDEGVEDRGDDNRCSSDDWKTSNVDDDDGSIILTPRAIGIGSIAHLALAGMDIAISKYELYERPSGLKRNYW